jgi:hypothetical protein
MTDLVTAQKLEAAMDKLGEAAAILNQLDYEDGRIRYCLANLEGLDQGWFHRSTADREYMIDILFSMYWEAKGNTFDDYWRGHPVTSEEAMEYN